MGELAELAPAPAAAPSTASTCSCGGAGEVTETRPSTDGMIRRARRCVVCSARWSTREVRVPERLHHSPIVVVVLPRNPGRVADVLRQVADRYDDEAP